MQMIQTIRRSLLATSALAAVLLLTGCFDIEQSMTLDRDLSGTAGFSMTVNFEPMVLMMLRMQREMAGTKGDPTPAELDKARKEFLASKKEKGPTADIATQKADFEKSLPPGVKLLDSGVDDQGLKTRIHVKLRFDDVNKLRQVRLSKDEGQQGQPGPKNPYSEPFTGLTVKDEGKTILLTSAAVNPMKEQEQGGPEPTPEMKKQMEEAFQGFRVAFKLDTPLEVVESNATRRDGHTLYWEYDLKSLEKMSKEQAQAGIRVRLRK